MQSGRTGLHPNIAFLYGYWVNCHIKEGVCMRTFKLSPIPFLRSRVGVIEWKISRRNLGVLSP